MGVIRFQLQNREQLPDAMLERIYVTNLEEVPARSATYWESALLTIEREGEESGQVHVPWNVAGHGQQLLSTASLMPRARAYQLEVELARGTMNSLRNQLSAWQAAGLVVPPEYQSKLHEALKHFSLAATCQHEPSAAAEHARVAIEQGVQLISQLGQSYSVQALSIRRRATPKLLTLLGINLGTRRVDKKTAGQIQGVFNAAVVPLSWRQLETSEGCLDWTASDEQIKWAQDQGLKISSGPLVQLGPAGIPDWLYLFEGRFDSLLQLMADHVEAVVDRYRGKVHLWQIASRINTPGFLSLDDEQRFRITVRLIELVRDLDPRTPALVTFDQPWAEYMAHQDTELSPIHFADALMRGDLGLAGLGLEINAGYFPGGCLDHNLFDYSRKLDRWSLLGVPLLVSITVPSSSAADPLAVGKAKPLPEADSTTLSPQTQQAWVEAYLPMLLAKHCVQVVVWNQLHDSDPHEFPHGGLLDHHSWPKPALDSLRSIRDEYLL